LNGRKEWEKNCSTEGKKAKIFEENKILVPLAL
jgi:hypothetical protein